MRLPAAARCAAAYAANELGEGVAEGVRVDDAVTLPVAVPVPVAVRLPVDVALAVSVALEVDVMVEVGVAVAVGVVDGVSEGDGVIDDVTAPDLVRVRVDVNVFVGDAVCAAEALGVNVEDAGAGPDAADVAAGDAATLPAAEAEDEALALPPLLLAEPEALALRLAEVDWVLLVFAVTVELLVLLIVELPVDVLVLVALELAVLLWLVILLDVALLVDALELEVAVEERVMVPVGLEVGDMESVLVLVVSSSSLARGGASRASPSTSDSSLDVSGSSLGVSGRTPAAPRDSSRRSEPRTIAWASSHTRGSTCCGSEKNRFWQ